MRRSRPAIRANPLWRGKARGTIWVVSHSPDRQFDAEDFRVMTNLGTFTGIAYQTVLSLQASRKAEQRFADADAALQRLAAIIHFSDDAILSKNLDGIIDSWNGGAERLFGYTMNSRGFLAGLLCEGLKAELQGIELGI